MRKALWLLVTSAIALAAARPAAASEGHPHGDGLALDCITCHTLDAWTPLVSPLVFDHGETGFPLADAHGEASCRECHQSLVFPFVATACADCHRDAHAGELGFVCEVCHDALGWENQRDLFDVHNRTLFTLLAPHAALECQACHGEQNPWRYAATPVECDACHLDDYQATADPGHVANGFSTECLDCHSPVARRWEEAVFLHPATFPLRGAHRPLDCEECHASGFAGTPTDCFSCHRADYNQAKDPDHAAAGFPTACESCHDENDWEGAVFDHNVTAFPLRGAHGPLDCDACHASGFAGTPTDCFSCHRADYNQAKDPDHAAAGFPTACESCHDENDWEGAEFNHNQTAFPLRDSHRGLDCEACHASGFAGTPTDCFSCHARDYNRANDPDHAAAGFPTTCETCHDATRWDDSSWDHLSLFPIYSGEHRGEWSDCSDCHVSQASFATFECVFCHEHRKSEMDDEHDEVSDYRYESRACLNCHPDGRE